jgi:hypothetical protein
MRVCINVEGKFNKYLSGRNMSGESAMGVGVGSGGRKMKATFYVSHTFSVRLALFG